MTRIRYTASAGSQGETYTRRRRARLVGEDVRRRVFVYDMDPDADNAPPLPSIARTDEAVGVGARGSTPRDAVKAPIEATGPNPRLFACGRPFCSDDANGVDDAEGGAA